MDLLVPGGVNVGIYFSGMIFRVIILGIVAGYGDAENETRFFFELN